MLATLRTGTLALLILMSWAPLAAAADVVIEGVPERIRANIQAYLKLDAVTDLDLSDPLSRSMLAEQIVRDAGEAMRPFGYEHPEIEVELAPNIRQAHRLVIDPGPPVTLARVEVDFVDSNLDAVTHRGLRSRLALNIGDRLDHTDYEMGKRRIQGALLDLGRLQARLLTHEIRVDRVLNQAEIRLEWSVGPRFLFGPVEFLGSQFDPSFLQRFVPFEPGDDYSQSEVLLLHRRLADTNYFERIDLTPLIEQHDDHAVPIRVRLTPNPRNRYEVGFSYGTDSGAGVTATYVRRWVNKAGHRFQVSLDAAQDRTLGEAVYRIPKARDVDDYYAVGLTATDRQQDSYDYLQRRLSVSNFRHSKGWRRSDTIEFLDEDFVIAGESGSSQLLLLKLSLSRSTSDDPVLPTRGYQISGFVQGTTEALGSDSDLVQVDLAAKRIVPVGEASRVIGRVHLGATWVDAFSSLPASLRYFTGGDRSIRGYAYEALGPRNDDGEVVGGRYLAIGSLEFEWTLRPNWRMAVFTDAGNAFDQSGLDAAYSAGIGLRYVSPIGLIRVDVAQSISDSDASPRFHLVVGPEL